MDGKNLRSELEIVEGKIAAKTRAKQRMLTRFIDDDDPDVGDRIDTLKREISGLNKNKEALLRADMETLDSDDLKARATEEASRLRELLEESEDKANQVLRELLRDPDNPDAPGRFRPR